MSSIRYRLANGPHRPVRHNPFRVMVAVAVAFLLVASLFATQSPPALAQNGSGSEEAQADPSPDMFRPCRQDTRRVEVVVTLDQSESMRTSDPSGEQRKNAVERLRNLLVEDRDELKEKGVDLDVQIALIGFNSGEQREEQTFAPLDRVTTSYPTQKQIERASTNDELNTDYENAISTALMVFSKSKETLDDEVSKHTCRVFVFLTDGEYDPLRGSRQIETERKTGRELVSSMCDIVEETYGKQLQELEVKTYAVLFLSKDSPFRLPPNEADELVNLSKQFILALTGPSLNPLLEEVNQHETCLRNGRVSDEPQGVAISLDNILNLSGVFGGIVDSISLGWRRPIWECKDNATAFIQGAELPVQVEAQVVCSILLPLDGATKLSVRQNAQPEETAPLNLAWSIETDEPAHGGGNPLQINDISQKATDRKMVNINLHTHLDDGSQPETPVPLQIEMKWIPDPSLCREPVSEELADCSETNSKIVMVTIQDRNQVFVDAVLICPSPIDVGKDSIVSPDFTSVTPSAKQVCQITPPSVGKIDVTVPDKPEYAGSPFAGVEKTFTREGREASLEAGEPPVDLNLSWPRYGWEMGFGEFTREVEIVMEWSFSDGEPTKETKKVSVTMDWSSDQVLLNTLTADMWCEEEKAVADGSGGPWTDKPLRADTTCTAKAPLVGEAIFSMTPDRENPTWQLLDENGTPITNGRFTLKKGDPDRPLLLAAEPLSPNQDYSFSEDVTFSADWQVADEPTLINPEPATITVTARYLLAHDRIITLLRTLGLLLLLLLLAWLVWLAIARARQGAPGRLLPKARGWTWTEKQFPIVDKSGMATSPELEKFSPERSVFSRVSTLNGGWNLGRLRLRLRKTFHPWARPEVQVSAEEFNKLHCDPAGPTASTLRPPLRDGFVVTAAQPNRITVWIAMPPNGNLEHLVEKVKAEGKATLSDPTRFDTNQTEPPTSQKATSRSDQTSKTHSSAHPSEPPPPPRPSKPTPIGDLATAQATLNPTAEPPTQPSKPPPPSSKPPPIGGRLAPSQATRNPASGNPSTPPSKPPPPPSSKPPPIGRKPPPMGRTPGRPSKPPRKPR